MRGIRVVFFEISWNLIFFRAKFRLSLLTQKPRPVLWAQGRFSLERIEESDQTYCRRGSRWTTDSSIHANCPQAPPSPDVPKKGSQACSARPPGLRAHRPRRGRRSLRAHGLSSKCRIPPKNIDFLKNCERSPGLAVAVGKIHNFDFLLAKSPPRSVGPRRIFT